MRRAAWNGCAAQFQLAVAKGRMDAVFTENRVNAGDPGYEWDKRTEFAAPVEDSGWDSD